MSISNHSTTRKSWRSDAPIILLGWECHTGGSRSKPTVHRCRPKTGGCGLLTRTHDEPTKKNNMVAERQLQFHSQPASSAQYVTTECAVCSRCEHRGAKRWSLQHSVTRSTVAVQAGVQLGQDDRRQQDPESEMQVEQNSLSSSRVSDQ